MGRRGARGDTLEGSGTVRRGVLVQGVGVRLRGTHRVSARMRCNSARCSADAFAEVTRRTDTTRAWIADASRPAAAFARARCRTSRRTSAWCCLSSACVCTHLSCATPGDASGKAGGGQANCVSPAAERRSCWVQPLGWLPDVSRYHSFGRLRAGWRGSSGWAAVPGASLFGNSWHAADSVPSRNCASVRS